MLSCFEDVNNMCSAYRDPISVPSKVGEVKAQAAYRAFYSIRVYHILIPVVEHGI